MPENLFFLFKISSFMKRGYGRAVVQRYQYGDRISGLQVNSPSLRLPVTPSLDPFLNTGT